MEKAEKYYNGIKEALTASSEACLHDDKTEFIMLACCIALTWIAEELHEVNERCKDGY